MIEGLGTGGAACRLRFGRHIHPCPIERGPERSRRVQRRCAALRPYEVAVIFDATLEETVVRETTDRIGEFIKSRGGTPGHVDRWGRRQFAYEMDHKTEGNYVFIELTAEPAVVAELDRMLSLSDDVLRHRVIRQPERVAGRRPVPTAPASKTDSPVGE